MKKEDNENQQQNNNAMNEDTKDEKDLKIEILEKELSDSKDRLLRKAAEFENYKRRTENDQLNLFKYAAEGFIVKLLTVVDDFERSLDHIDKAKDVAAVKEGIKLVYDKFMKIIQDQGVKKIDAAGKAFDVNYHEALMQQKADGIPPHTVISELEKGYMYKDRVIRHAKVIVSEESTEETSANGASGNNSNNEGN